MPEQDHFQCDPTTLQNRHGQGGVNQIYFGGMELESVTPAKLCIALLLRNYVQNLKGDVNECNDQYNIGEPYRTGGNRGDHIDDAAPWSSFNKNLPKKNIFNDITNINEHANNRRAFCMLAIKLIQGTDLQLKEMISMVSPLKEIENSEGLEKKAMFQTSYNYQRLGVSFVLLTQWKRDMEKTVAEGVGGLMDISGSLEKMVFADKRLQEDQNLPILHRASVVGLFLRRIILCFDKLSFSEVSQLYHNFKRYVRQGMATDIYDGNYEVTDELGKQYLAGKNNDISNVGSNDRPVQSSSSMQSNSTLDLDHSSFSEEMLNFNLKKSLNDINKQYSAKIPCFNDEKELTKFSTNNKIECQIPNRLTRRQAELYIANQVELLQTAEVHAQKPNQIEKVVKAILKHNPDLLQAHFLSYLNCLRVKDYCDAINNLNQCFSGVSPVADRRSVDSMNSDILTNLEECNRGFRYAALNLAALHARFNHKEEAASALREAVMMAQESNDHVCLQHALSWIYRIHPESERLKLIQRCVNKSQELGLSYLQSLGEQAMSQFTAMLGLSGPETIMEILTRSDILNCQHSIIELVTSSYSQKSAFWSMFGRSHMCSIVSQLLLNLDYSGNGSIGNKREDGIYITSEAMALSLSNIIRHLHDRGEEKLVNKVVELAKSLFNNDSSVSGDIWRYTSIQVGFERALHATNWPKASTYISEAEAFSITSFSSQSEININDDNSIETLLMRLQLHLYRGDAEAASNVRKKIFLNQSGSLESKTLNPHQQVRLLLLETELACLTNSYANAIPPLIQAASICNKHLFQFLGAMVALHTAHIQLQFGLSFRALNIIQKCLPTIFAHGSLFECGRAKLLLAKCLVASAPKGRCLTST